MTNLSGISLTCFAGDCVGGSPITIGAPLMAANSANAVVLRSLTLKLIASMRAPPCRRRPPRHLLVCSRYPHRLDLPVVAEYQHFYKFIIRTMMLLFSHDSAIGWE